MKRKNQFCEKVSMNKNIQWHCMQLELNCIEVRFNWIKFKFKFINSIQRDCMKFEFNWEMKCKLTEKILKIYLWIGVVKTK